MCHIRLQVFFPLCDTCLVCLGKGSGGWGVGGRRASTFIPLLTSKTLKSVKQSSPVLVVSGETSQGVVQSLTTTQNYNWLLLQYSEVIINTSFSPCIPFEPFHCLHNRADTHTQQARNNNQEQVKLKKTNPNQPFERRLMKTSDPLSIFLPL